jgi:hypothetical protein
MKKIMAVLGIILMVLCWIGSGPNVQLTGYRETVDQRAVPAIHCGAMGGTGVVVGPHEIITANHVVGHEHTCDAIFGIMTRRAVVVSADPRNDVAVLRVEIPLKTTYVVNCSGVISGQTYYVAGYPNSMLEFHTDTYLGTNQYFAARGPNGEAWKFRVMNGSAIEGMSGGPVLNAQHEVVAVVNARPLTGRLALVKELHFTQVCTGAPTDK